jgi:hypothetical protein
MRVGDIGAPDMIGRLNPQSMHKMGVRFMPLRGSGSVGLLMDWHQPHMPPDVLLVHEKDLVLQRPRHLLQTVERGSRELFVDHYH